MPIPDFREDGWLPVGHHLATWEEVVTVFGGEEGSARAELTRKLLVLRDALRSRGINGILVLDGSYISMKWAPNDFDVLLIGPTDIQSTKESDPELASLLDAQQAEENGYTFFYVPFDSPYAQVVYEIFDFTKQGLPKGVVEVEL